MMSLQLGAVPVPLRTRAWWRERDDARIGLAQASWGWFLWVIWLLAVVGAFAATFAAAFMRVLAFASFEQQTNWVSP